MKKIVHCAGGLCLMTAATLPACGGDEGEGTAKGASTAFSSGLPGDQAFANVTDDDIRTACEAWANYAIDPWGDTVCRRAGVRAAMDLPSVESLGCATPAPCVTDSATGTMDCTYECQDVCTYDCSGSTPADLDASCTAAKAAACAPTDAQAQEACAEREAECPASGFEEAITFCNFQKPTSTCTATVAEFEACVEEYFILMDESLADAPTCSAATLATLQAWTVAPRPTEGRIACLTFNEKCASAFSD